MPRKKSAAKRAREEASKETTISASLAVTDSIPSSISNSKPEPAEQQKTKEKIDTYDDDDDSASSPSEEEDEYGELITEEVEEGIGKVLKAIRTDPKQLLNPDVKFFDDPEKAVESIDKSEKAKPIYLKDYHRMNLLAGGYKDEDNDNEYGTIDGEKPFVIAQREERDQLLSDIKNAFNDDEDGSDDDFLKKKDSPRSNDNDDETIKLPDPETNQQAFLDAFLGKQAWIPKKNDKVINLDKIDNGDDQEFDDAVEQFEHAYNFRYEDPNAAEIVSYARNQATLRRSATNLRKRQREKEQELKQKEEKEKQELLKKKKTAKVNKIMDRLAKIKEAVGDDVSDELIQRVFGESLINDDFDDADWDNKMAEIFNEQYYGAEVAKPEWDEDDEIMTNFHNGLDGNHEEEGEESAEDDEAPPTKKSKKEKLKEKKAAKKEKESLKERAQSIVDANTPKILDEVEEERGRSKGEEEIKFKYREVSPETFGLTTRDILLAEDKDLNMFIGIKKFAPYRPKELRLKDKRKYTKKKHLQQWRKDVFNDKNGPKVPEDQDINAIWIPIQEGSSKKEKSKNGKGKDNRTKN